MSAFPEPEIGQDVYLPSELYLSHGRDDFRGGLCRIVGISRDVVSSAEHPFVEVAERPGHWYSWQSLMDEQDRLRDEHGDRRGHPDPDRRPEFNEDWADA